MNELLDVVRGGYGETTEFQENDVSVAHVLHPYHRFQRPRPGESVYLYTGSRARVMMVDLDGKLFVVDDVGRKQHCWREDVTLDPSRPRLDMHAWLSELIQITRERLDVFGLSAIAMHFHGANGARYANRSAHAWCVRAILESHVLGDLASDLIDWLRQEITELEAMGLPAPEQPSDELAEHWCFDIRCFDVDTLAAEQALALASLDRALEIGRPSIDDTRDDASATAPSEWTCGSLCVDLESGAEAVILGMAPGANDPAYLLIITLDEAESYTRHVSGLAIDGEKIDEVWLWDVVLDAMSGGNTQVLWWIAMRPPPEPGSVAEQELAMVQVAAAAGLMRVAARELPGIAKKAERAMRAAFKVVSKENRARLWAAYPELAAGGKPVRIANNSALDMSRLFGDLLSRARDALPEGDLDPSAEGGVVGLEQLAKHELPAIEPASDQPPAAAPSLQPALRAEPAPIDAGVVPEASPHAAEEEQTPPAPLRVSGPSARARPPLQFSEHDLLTSEWPLVAGEGAFDAAAETTLGWLGEKLGMTLPTSWANGRHEIERQGTRLELEASPTLFAFRLEHPDAAEPARWWRLEATILAGVRDSPTMVGLRLFARDLIELPPPSLSAPGLLRRWAEGPGLVVAGLPTNRRLRVKDAETVQRLDETIRSPGRGSMVCVLAPGLEKGIEHRMLGLCQIERLEPAAEQDYASRFGAMAPGCAHAFLPGEMRPRAVDLSAREGKALLWRMAFESRRRTEIPSFRDIADAIRESNARPRVDPAMQAIADAAAQAEARAAAASREARDLGELLEIALAERDEKASELDAAQAGRERADAELQDALEEIARLKARLHAPTSHRDSQPRTVPAADPTTLAELPGWVKSLEPRLVITDKALRHAVDVQHRDVAKIYATLRALADQYWTMRWGDDADARRKWTGFINNQHLRCSNVGEAALTGRFEDEYKFVHEGRTRRATLHIQGSSSRDPLRCLRIYFWPDDERQQIVVSHLPTHLTNSHT